MTDAPEPEITPVRESLRNRLSFVWLVPIGALLISLAVVWQTYANQGPLIEIVFENASGVKPDETELRYRDVPVGVVETVTFTENLSDVLVKVRLDKEVAPFVDEGAQFWVVRPEVSARGVSGLDTVLSGVFIEGSWDNTIGPEASRFEGMDRPPLVRTGQQGISIMLRSSDVKGLSDGTPILYRGIEVGRIDNLRLADDGVSVVANAFIRSPEDRLVTTATRFWDTSGFTFTFGTQGAQLDFSSLATLLGGGVAFDTIVSGGSAVEPDHQFQLFAGEEMARNSVFTDGDEGTKLNLAVIFEGSVSGLSAGAAVEFQGINIGTVTAITGLVDEARFHDRNVRLLSTLELRPAKMGLPSNSTIDEALNFLDDQVQRGLRAQLQNASILTGGLKVALLVPDSIGPKLPAKIERDAEPYPVLPSIPATLSDFSDTAEGVFNRINELPIEELLGSAINVMDSVNRLLNEDGVIQTPAEVLGLIGDIRGVVGSEQVQALPAQASGVMDSLTNSVNTLESLLSRVEEAGAADKLVAALDAAQGAADAVSAAVADVPDLLRDVQGVAQSAQALMETANDLPLDALIAQTNSVLASAETLLSAPDTRALPGELVATIKEARGVIAELRASGIVSQISTTIGTTEQAIKDVRAAVLPVIEAAKGAADSLSAASTDLPGVVDRANAIAVQIEALVEKANALPLDELARRASALIDSTNTLLASEDTQAVPGALNAALAQLEGVLADMREGGLIDNANATLAATQEAAGAIAKASSDLPGLVARMNRVLAQAEEVITGYRTDGALGSEAKSALRDVREAAKSVSSLARAIERAPNSLLFGR